MQKGTARRLRDLPKAELHLHLEGSVTPQRLGLLAAKYGTDYAGSEGVRRRDELYSFRGFYEFLEAYKTVCTHLLAPEDYLSVLEDLEVYLVEENIRYAEVIFTPSIPWKHGRDGREVLSALVEKAQRTAHRHDITICWILDCVRQFGREAAEQTAELASEFRNQGVVAVGLGGDEKSLPAREFEEVFAWVRAHELFVHVHAGEIGEPSEVWEALQVLGANRIGHGIHSARDPKLMEYLRAHAVGLDICLTSNMRTRAWPMLESHPLPLLIKRGVPVSLSTDDPGLFGTSLSRELEKAADLFSFTSEDLNRILLQAVRSSFLAHDRKMELMQRFGDAFLKKKDPLSPSEIGEDPLER